MWLQCASVLKPFLQTPEPLKSDPFTLPALNSGFPIRVPVTPRAGRFHPCNPISSSSIRKWMRSFFSVDPLPLLSRVIPIILLAFSLEGEAYGSPGPPPSYTCEQVQSYYSIAEHKKGEALRKALHAVVARHQFLSYKEVWDALKILDASEVNDPEASSGIVEIYSLRVVPKKLAGKPEGWNREHLWPRSYGLTYGPSLTDLHNIHPADVNVICSEFIQGE